MSSPAIISKEQLVSAYSSLQADQILDCNYTLHSFLPNLAPLLFDHTLYYHCYDLPRIFYEQGINRELTSRSPIYLQIGPTHPFYYPSELFALEIILAPWLPSNSPDNSKKILRSGPEITELMTSLRNMKKSSSKFSYEGLKLPPNYIPFVRAGVSEIMRVNSRKFYHGQAILYQNGNNPALPPPPSSPPHRDMVKFHYFSQLPGNILTHLAQFLNLADLVRRISLLSWRFHTVIEQNNPPVYSTAQKFNMYIPYPQANRWARLRNCGILVENNEKSHNWAQYVQNLANNIVNINNSTETEQGSQESVHSTDCYNPKWAQTLPHLRVLTLSPASHFPAPGANNGLVEISWENSLIPYSVQFVQLNTLKLDIFATVLASNWLALASPCLSALKSLSIKGWPNNSSILRNFTTESLHSVANSGQKTLLDSLENLTLTGLHESGDQFCPNFRVFTALQRFSGEFYSPVENSVKELKGLYGLSWLREVSLIVRLTSRRHNTNYRDMCSNLHTNRADEQNQSQNNENNNSNNNANPTDATALINVPLASDTENLLDFLSQGASSLTSLDFIDYCPKDLKFLEILGSSLEKLKLRLFTGPAAAQLSRYSLQTTNQLNSLGTLVNLRELALQTRFLEEIVALWPIFAGLQHLVSLNLESLEVKRGEIEQKVLQERFQLKVFEEISLAIEAAVAVEGKNDDSSSGSNAAPKSPLPTTSVSPPKEVRIMGKFRGKLSLEEPVQFIKPQKTIINHNNDDNNVDSKDSKDKHNNMNSSIERVESGARNADDAIKAKLSFPSLRNLSIVTKYGLRFPLLVALFHNYPAPQLTELSLRDSSWNFVRQFFGTVTSNLNRRDFQAIFLCIKNFVLALESSNLIDIRPSMEILREFIEKGRKNQEFPLVFSYQSRNSVEYKVKNSPVKAANDRAQILSSLCRKYYSEEGSQGTEKPGNYQDFARAIYQQLSNFPERQYFRVLEADINALLAQPGSGEEAVTALKQVVSDLHDLNRMPLPPPRESTV
jgi:hypothetical protein